MKRGSAGLVWLIAGLAVVIVAGVAAYAAIERWACEQQMTGSGSRRVGHPCGTPAPDRPNAFRYAIDEGSERILYLSGGTDQWPETIRLTREGTILVERVTHQLGPDNIDVCRDQPPLDERWWSAVIDNAIATAIRSSDMTTYRIEGWIEGAWQPLELIASGCRWEGHG